MRANSISGASCIALLNDVGLPLINSWREIAGKSPVKKRCNSIGDVAASPGYYDSVNSFCSSTAKSETFSPEA